MPDVVPAEAELAARFASPAASPAYGIWRRDDGAFVGSALLEALAEPWVWSLAYWLDVAARGQGYATEAAAALARVALELDEALRVEIHAVADNEPSTRVAERLGFVAAPREGERFVRHVLDDPDEAAAAAPDLVVLDAAGQPLRLERSSPEGRHVLAAWRRLSRHLVDAGTRVRARVARGRAWILVDAPIGPETAFTARELLAHNRRLAAGALHLEEGALVLRAVLSLADTTEWHLHETVALVAHEARRLAARAAGRTTAELALANYAE